MEGFRPGAVVGAGMMTILDDTKILTPSRGPDSPRYMNTAELRVASLVSDSYRRIIDIILDRLESEAIENIFAGRRKGKAYFSDRDARSVLGGSDLQSILSDPENTHPDFSKETTFDKEKVNAFLQRKTLPVFVTFGNIESRQTIVRTLNSLVDLSLNSEETKEEMTAFETMFPSQEAFFIAQKVFSCNTISTGFHRDGSEEVTAFLLIAVGKTTIHWIVYDDYIHFVTMSKQKSVDPGAHNYIYMDYNPDSEDDRIQVAVNTHKAIEAWKEMRRL